MNDLATIVPDQEPLDGKPKRKRRGGLFVTDAEIVEKLSVPEKIARQAIHMLDKNPRSGFPQKQPLWGDRRFWPAVRDYFQETYGLKFRASNRRDRDE